MANARTDSFHEEQSIFRSFKNAGFNPRVIFEVGSAQADWSWSVSLVFPEAEFHLFEPLIDRKATYRESTDRVLQRKSSFRLHPVALGATDGRTRIGSREERFSPFAFFRQRFGGMGGMFEVPVYRLETIVSQLKLPMPDVLKLNDPGTALEVLKGAGPALDSVQIIQLESWLTRHDRRRTPRLHEVIDFLREKSFSLVNLGRFFFSPIHELHAVDVYFARVDLLAEFGSRLSPGHLGGGE
jgi:FkbM family methyltransferase